MILFIEDEGYYNDPYKESLQDAGYKVILVRNINEAINIFSKRLAEIQLVILDIMFEIPDDPPLGFDVENALNGTRSGIEVLRLLNEVPKGTDVPKIILTNVAEERFHLEYQHSNSVKGCYKKKDVNLAKLVEIVNEIIKGK